MRPCALAAGVYFGRPEERRVVGALELCRTSYAPAQRVPEHVHDAAYLCLALGGSFRERSRHGEQEVAAGAVVLHRPGDRHRDRFGPRPASCLNVSFGPGWGERAGDWLAQAGPASYAAPGALAAPVWRLAHEFDQHDEASALALEGLVLELCAFFARASRREERRTPRWMATAIERLRSEESVTLTVLARAAGVHASTLVRGFRHHQGCSPGEFRRRWRLERAREALRASALPIAEVAARCGFADQSHLTRALRAATGLTPAALRRAARA